MTLSIVTALLTSVTAPPTFVQHALFDPRRWAGQRP